MIYITRLVNKKDNSQGKGDIFFLASEQLEKVGNYSVGKAKKVLKKLQEHEYIKKIRTGNNLIGKANTYKVMNLQPTYIEGKEVDLSEAEHNLSEELLTEGDINNYSLGVKVLLIFMLMKKDIHIERHYHY